MSVRVYVGNLSRDLERQELEAVFAEHSEAIISTKLIADKKTGKCRGFGFVTVNTDEQADAIVAQFDGFMLQDSPLKVEKAMPRSKDKPESGEGTSSRRSNKGGRGAASAGTSAEAAQPDPRWAGELEKLKQLLAAQQTPTA